MDNPSAFGSPTPTHDSGLPQRRRRTRRGEARTSPAGMDLLAEYDRRIQKLLRSAPGSVSGVISGPGESGHV